MTTDLNATAEDHDVLDHAGPALRRLDQLPGPRALPLIGNAHQVDRPRIHQDIERWAKQYGPLFHMALGPQAVLVVGDHELVTKVLKDRPGTFRRSARMTELLLETGLKPGVFHAEGDAWQNQRRMVMSGFSPGNIRRYYPSLLRVTQRLRGRWTHAARTGQSIELLPDLMRFTVDAVAGLAFGTDINTLEGGEDVIQRHLDKILPTYFRRIFSLVPYWRLLKLPGDREFDRSVRAINVVIADFIAQARERLRLDPNLREHPNDLLEAMIAAADQPGSGVNDDDVAGNMFTLLLAGEDTTASTLAWMIYLLRQNPKALRRATAQVRGVVADTSEMTLDQLASLDYLEACANETMRLKPVGPFNPVEAVHDTIVGDVLVPAGTVVWCMVRHDSVSAEHFPDPLAFKPERWLETEQATGGVHSAKRVSMPFGSGPRVCPGRYLALLEMKMALAMLLTHFDIDQVSTPDGLPAQEHMAFTMSPIGLSMKLRQRGSD
ncbi:MAG: cytochrome P450 [Rubrivivax sp.]|nr:MAG: cytochrome P450 [Rubrivivax sp.]